MGKGIVPSEGRDNPVNGTSVVRQLLDRLTQLSNGGIDPEFLKDTPRRVWKMLEEMTVGYHADTWEILSKKFKEDVDQIIIVRKIPFASLCEHHLMPFTGTVDIGYLPGEFVVGLSKLARIVEAFSKRLQIQERMTKQIAECLNRHLEPKGVGVVVRGIHSCMACRGIQKPGEMITSAMLGVFRDVPAARSEFFSLCNSSR